MDTHTRTRKVGKERKNEGYRIKIMSRANQKKQRKYHPS